MDFNFREAVFSLVKQIPEGMVSTYGDVAEALGDKAAARAVGVVLNSNPRLIETPCHRIVYSSGGVGGFKLGVEEKIRLLEGEGVVVADGCIADFDRLVFKDFKTSRPLERLRLEQEALAEKVDTSKDFFSELSLVGGVDVNYSKDFKACGALVVCDYNTLDIVESKTTTLDLDFPYIPTYLSYREYPAIESLFKRIEKKPDILLIDGNGILHPRGIGLASYAGLMLGIPAIGVAKKLLCGEKQSNGKIILNNRVAGYELRKNHGKPIYVSPGHKITPASSKKIVEILSRHGMPEPLRQAHILSKRK